MNSKLTTRVYLGLIILMGITSGAMAIYTTVNGPWGYSDPVVYISTANSILHGQGVGYYEGDAKFAYTTIQPPFYSLVLSGIGLTGINLVEASRWLNILALVASVFIAGWIFLRHSGVPILGVIASVLLCTFPSMIVMFSSSYSEPLFILLFLLAGLGLLQYQQKENKAAFYFLALVLGLIPFTRYSGIAILLSGIVSFIVLAPGKIQNRTMKIVQFISLSCLPTVLWLIWVYLAGNHNLGGRDVGADWVQLGTKFQSFRGLFMDIVWKWIPFQNPVTKLSYRLRFFMMGFGLLFMIILTFLAERKLHDSSRNNNPKSDLLIFFFFGLSSLAYIWVLIATYLFTLPTIDIDNRMLLPFFVSLALCLLGAFGIWQIAWFREKMRILQVIPWLVGVLCVYWYVPQIGEKIELYHPGIGLTAFHWDRSEIIQAVRSLPADIPVISNDWELLLLWTQRPIHGFWITFPSNLPIQTSAYGKNRGDVAQSIFCDQGAALVIFNDFSTQFTDRIGNNAHEMMVGLFADLSIQGTFPEGTIYFCN
jgi:hypothetical protein